MKLKLFRKVPKRLNTRYDISLHASHYQFLHCLSGSTYTEKTITGCKVTESYYIRSGQKGVIYVFMDYLFCITANGLKQLRYPPVVQV